MLRLFGPQTPAQRLVDRFAGISRRRRLLAYASIAGGIAILRPVLVRLAMLTVVVAVLVAGLANGT